MTQPITDLPSVPVQQPGEDEAARGEKKKGKGRKKAERRRAMQSMFRIAYQNHIALSKLADQKYGMLIHINGFIISLVLALLTPKFGDWSWLMAPGAALAFGSLVSLALAVIGSRPRFERTRITVDDVRNNQGNALFFGHFSTMELADFQESIRALGKDQGLLTDALARQLYSMGKPLAKKYRYLQHAYTAFLVGVIAAGVLFAAALIWR